MRRARLSAILLFLLGSASTARAQVSLGPELLPEVLGCWLTERASDSKQYTSVTFAELAPGDPAIEAAGGRFGTFTGGLHSLLHQDANVYWRRFRGRALTPARCLATLLARGDGRGGSVLQLLADAAGEPLYMDPIRDPRPLAFYNPAVIKAAARLLPDPNAPVLGVTVRQIYRRVFARLARMMTEAYVHLVDTGTLDREVALYWGWMAEIDPRSTFCPVDPHGAGSRRRAFDALCHFYLRFGGIDLPNSDDDLWTSDYDWRSEHALGFWVRRGVDGTDEAVWAALRQIMQGYDKAWYDSLRQTYTSGKVRW